MFRRLETRRFTFQSVGDPFEVVGVERESEPPDNLMWLTTLAQHLQLIVHIKDALCLPDDLLQLAILDL